MEINQRLAWLSSTKRV